MKVYKYNDILMRHTLVEEDDVEQAKQKEQALYNYYLSAISKSTDENEINQFKSKINDLYKSESINDKDFGKLTLYIDNKITRLKAKTKKTEKEKMKQQKENDKKAEKAISDKKKEVSDMRAKFKNKPEESAEPEISEKDQ